MLHLLAGILAALVIVGPTALIATAFGWYRSGFAPWTAEFWGS